MTTINTICKGSTYNHAPDNKHMYIFTSFDRPNQCYYCGHLEEAN